MAGTKSFSAATSNWTRFKSSSHHVNSDYFTFTSDASVDAIIAHKTGPLLCIITFHPTAASGGEYKAFAIGSYLNGTTNLSRNTAAGNLGAWHDCTNLFSLSVTAGELYFLTARSSSTTSTLQGCFRFFDVY